MFDDSVKKNIAYAKDDATDEEIIKACKFAAADEFIKKLPKGYNTVIGENGETFWWSKTKNIDC